MQQKLHGASEMGPGGGTCLKECIVLFENEKKIEKKRKTIVNMDEGEVCKI